MKDIFLDNAEKKILELDARKKIYEVVRKYAGSHFREIERKSQLPTGSVKYHLSYLKKHGLVKEERDGNNVRYFPKDFKPENKKILGLLRQKSVRDITLFILTNDNCNHEDIVKTVHISPSTVSWHLKKLEENNIVDSKKEGRKTYYTLLVDKDEIVNLLITYRESFLDAIVDRVVEMWD